MSRLIPLNLLFTLVAACFVSAPVAGQAQMPLSSNEQDGIVKLIGQGRSPEALAELTKAVKKNKADAEAWYYLGVVYLQLKNYKKATSAFENSTKVRPDLAQAHAAYAYSLVLRSKLGEAENEARKALAIEPENLESYYTLGIISLRRGVRDEAIKYADRVIALKPDFAEAYLIKSQSLVPFNGDAIIEKGEGEKLERFLRYKSAADSLEKYLELSPNAPDSQAWRDQIESLRFYMAVRSGSDQVYPGGAVTTKVRLIAKPAPSYPYEARQREVTGTVVLRAVFASDGSVKHILVVQGLPGGLTEQAVAAARRIKFIPANLNDKPVSMFMQLEYYFNLF